MRTCKCVSPAKARDQQAHHERPQQPTNGEDGHGQGVHEGQGLTGQSCTIPTDNCPVVKVLNILMEGRNSAGDRGRRRGGRDEGKKVEFV